MVARETCLHDMTALLAQLRGALTPPPAHTDPAALRARPSAVLVPLFVGSEGAPHLLFTQRATTLARHSGEISFPGGRADAGDVSLTATALREAHEEIGLEPKRVTPLGELPPVFTVVSNYLISPIVGAVTGSLAEIAPLLNSAEVAFVIDAPLPALADPTIARTELWSRGGTIHPVHFFQFGEHLIWGATAHILRELLALLPAT